MDEDIKDRLTKYMDAIESSASTAGDFVVEQTPLFAQEYLAWEFWSSAIGCGLLAVASAILAVVVIKAAHWAITLDDPEDHPEMLFLLPLFIVSILPIALCIQCGMHAMKVSIAPRVVLVEKVAELAGDSHRESK